MLGGRHFSTRPRAALPHVGALRVAQCVTIRVVPPVVRISGTVISRRVRGKMDKFVVVQRKRKRSSSRERNFCKRDRNDTSSWSLLNWKKPNYLMFGRDVSGLNADESKLSSMLTLRVELKEWKLNTEICWFKLCSRKLTFNAKWFIHHLKENTFL